MKEKIKRNSQQKDKFKHALGRKILDRSMKTIRNLSFKFQKIHIKRQK